MASSDSDGVGQHAPSQPPPPDQVVEVRDHDPVSSVYVSFKGLKRISPHSLIGECRSLAHVRTFGDLRAALEDADARLNELRLFKSLHAEISVEPAGVVDIAFIAEERSRECTVSGNVDKKGEMSCDLRVVQPALFGGPLCAMGSVGTTASQAREFVFRLSTPRFLGRRWNCSFDIARNSADETQASSYSEGVTHAIMKLSDPSGSESVFLEAALRDLYPAAAGHRLPSVEVQRARLRSLKTSLGYSFSRRWQDARDPSAGSGLGRGPGAQVGSNVELACAPGDVRFVRGDLEVGATCGLPLGLLWHVLGAGGLLLPLDGQPSCPQDRFFLGGASGSTAMLKGFKHRGAGPMGACRPREPQKPGGHLYDALGGDAMVNAFTAVSAPLRLPDGFSTGDARVFAFGALGSLVLAPWAGGGGGGGGLLEGLRRGARASVGVGVGVPLAGMGSLEFTLAHPVWAQLSDNRQRWQVGLRLSF